MVVRLVPRFLRLSNATGFCVSRANLNLSSSLGPVPDFSYTCRDELLQWRVLHNATCVNQPDESPFLHPTPGFSSICMAVLLCLIV